MNAKKLVRGLITFSLVAALIAVVVVSQNYDPTNPHATIDEEVWINGPNGHGHAVMNNQQPWKQCYPCHEKKGLGGEDYCISCHNQVGREVEIPKKTDL